MAINVTATANGRSSVRDIQRRQENPLLLLLATREARDILRRAQEEATIDAEDFLTQAEEACAMDPIG